MTLFERKIIAVTKQQGQRVKTLFITLAGLLVLLPLVACKSIKPQPEISAGHIQDTDAATYSDIPKATTVTPALPVPRPQKRQATHTVIVNNVPVTELLFSLARDANLNLDIDSDVSGYVTLNAIDQTLESLLDRIIESTNLTYEIKNNVLRIRNDKPALKYYRIDHLNMSRSSESSAMVSTQISSTGQGAGEGSSSGGGNNSETSVTNKTVNEFWETLTKNIAAIIHEEPTAAVVVSGEEAPAEEASAATSDGDNPNILINKESGIIGVRATKRQHKEIDLFLNEVLFSTQRQVLIEATIAEVSLSENYQAGIDWSSLETKLDKTISAGQAITDITLFERPSFVWQFTKDEGDGDSIQSTLSALETFGDVSIMSSPKVMALNNQTALLKVVDNIVYFTVEVSIETSEGGNGNTVGFVTYETEINTVPVGFVMSVTPYIGDDDSVTLNVRPTISRVIRQARDPNPALADAGVVSEIPVIQVREVESILKIESGNTAIMGGLMQDEINKTTRGVPFLSRLPFLGPLFRYDADKNEKTELVIFIRPLVIKNASINGDLKTFQQYLPSDRK